MTRHFFIVGNPASGSKKKLDHILAVVQHHLEVHQYPFEIFLTKPDKNAQKTVQSNLDTKYSDLIIIGGDGTINEAINGLNYDIPITIIPNGTGNDYVKMLDIGDSLQEHVSVISSENILQVDVGVCNGRKFLNGVGIGFDGQIVADMLGKKSLLSGPAKYYYHVLSILATFKSRLFDYMVDDQSLKKDLILLCVSKGSTFGGSFVLAPQAKLDDGKLHICEIGKINGLKRFLNLHRLQKGTHDTLAATSLYSCDMLSIAANSNLQAHIDGEPFGSPPFNFELIKGGLKIRVK